MESSGSGSERKRERKKPKRAYNKKLSIAVPISLKRSHSSLLLISFLSLFAIAVFVNSSVKRNQFD